MTGWRRHPPDDAATALANFALTLAKALLVCCVVLFVMIADVTPKPDGVRPKIEAMIVINWPTEAHVDVDTWMRNAEGGIVYYGHKEAGVMFLDRDDLGDRCLTVCEEITSLRGLTSGDYVLNLNVFAAAGLSSPGPGQSVPLRAPLTVHVKIMQMNPTVVTRYERDVVLRFVKEEKPVVRFRIAAAVLDQFDSDHVALLQQH